MAVVLGVAGMSVVGVVLTARSGDPSWLLLSAPFTLVLWLFSRFAPTGYTLAGDGVRVERRAGPVLIPYGAIRGADDQPRTLAGLTTFGSRGLFGHFGRFWSPRLGSYRLYLANQRQVVWLATDQGWVALSPDRPRDFLERLHRRLPAPPAD